MSERWLSHGGDSHVQFSARVGFWQHRPDGDLPLHRLHHRGWSPTLQEEEELMNTEWFYYLLDGITIETLYDLFHASAWILAVVALARHRK